MITEAQKSHDLPSASGNPGKSEVSSQPESKARDPAVPVVGSQAGPSAGDPSPSSCSQAERVRSPLLCLFVVFRSTEEWMMSTHASPRLLTLGAHLILSHFTHIPRDNVQPDIYAFLPWSSGWRVQLTISSPFLHLLFHLGTHGMKLELQFTSKLP